jgi:hypothetical protein
MKTPENPGSADINVKEMSMRRGRSRSYPRRSSDPADCPETTSSPGSYGLSSSRSRKCPSLRHRRYSHPTAGTASRVIRFRVGSESVPGSAQESVPDQRCCRRYDRQHKALLSGRLIVVSRTNRVNWKSVATVTQALQTQSLVPFYQRRQSLPVRPS